MAYNFDGSNDKIAYTLNANQTSLDTVSISYFFYADANAQYRRTFSLGPTYPNNQLNMEFDDGWGWVLTARWTTDRGNWSIAKPSTGSWQQHGITYNWGATTNDPAMYINGVSQTVTDRNTPVGTKLNTSTTFTLGADVSDQYFDGRLAEFGMWNRILTADEMLGLGKGFSPLFYPRGLVFYAPLIRSSRDIKGGVTGTITEAAVIAHPKIIYPNGTHARRFTTATPTPPATTNRYWRQMMGIGY